MSNALNEALEQAGEALKMVNALLPKAENLVNESLKEATKNLKGSDLKSAQKRLMQIQKLTKDAKQGLNVDSQVKTLVKQVKKEYNK